jgi:hypothetical protein
MLPLYLWFSTFALGIPGATWNKLGNIYIAWQCWCDRQNLKFCLREWLHWRQFSWANNMYVGGVSDTCLSGWWRNHGGFPTWLRCWMGIPIQWHPRTETHVGLHVKCPLFLSAFNQNWDVSTNFSLTPLYQIPLKSIKRSRVATMNRQTDRQGETNRRIFTTLAANAPRNCNFVTVFRKITFKFSNAGTQHLCEQYTWFIESCNGIQFYRFLDPSLLSKLCVGNPSDL